MQQNNSSNFEPIRPQNISCPASGTYSDKSEPVESECSQRGVIVAPPSGNTDNPDNMIVLHRGFDTLALSIQSNIGPELFQFLETEKERAEQDRQDVLIEYSGLQFHLKAHGGNGYRFILSGGPDGATWFFKKPNSKDKWGIRLSFGSYFMAMYGIEAAKTHCEHVLECLGIRYGPEDVSIARVDVCVDILVPDFELVPDNFVMHSSTGRRDFVTAEDISVNGKSGRVTSVTIGSSRNRQVIVYDKRAEVIAHSKSYWWAIWNDTLRRLRNDTLHTEDRTYTLRTGTVHTEDCTYTLRRDANHPELLTYRTLNPAPENADLNRVWRIEFRAGKDLLKDRWSIRTWKQLFDQFGDLCCEAGEVVRYTEPAPSDPNRARWPNHPLWEIACAEINDGLLEMRSGADPSPMKEVHREQHISVIFKGILGCSISLAALKDVEYEALPKFFDSLATDMKDHVNANTARAQKQLRDAKDRYVFMVRPSS